MPMLHNIRLWNGLHDAGVVDLHWGEGRISQIVPAPGEEREALYSVIPGLIDTHVHLASYSGSDFTDYRTWPLTTHSTTRVLHAYANARKALAAGVTTLRDMEADWCQISLRDAASQEILEGPRILAFGMVSMTGGHADLFTPPAVTDRPMPTADGPDACRKQVRTFARMGMEGIKIATGGGVLSMGDKVAWRNYTDEENCAIVDEAHALGMLVAAHAHDQAAIAAALRARVDSIEHGTLLSRPQAQAIAKRHLSIAPTLLINDRIADGSAPVPLAMRQKAQNLAHTRDQALQDARQNGVEFVLGTDSSGQLMPFGLQWDELARMKTHIGLSDEEIMRAATSRAAKAIGCAGTLGQIAPGFLADFVLVRGLPWTDIASAGPRNIVAVVSRGRVVSGQLPATP